MNIRKLKNIIKESVKELILKEQYNITPGDSPCSMECLQVFPNCKQWFRSLYSLGPFNSSNPNQPCQFLTNQIDNFQTQMAGMNPNGQWYATKQCKINVFMHLCDQNNCPNC